MAKERKAENKKEKNRRRRQRKATKKSLENIFCFVALYKYIFFLSSFLHVVCFFCFTFWIRCHVKWLSTLSVLLERRCIWLQRGISQWCTIQSCIISWRDVESERVLNQITIRTSNVYNEKCLSTSIKIHIKLRSCTSHSANNNKNILYSIILDTLLLLNTYNIHIIYILYIDRERAI